MFQVAEPFRRDERHDADNGVAYGEDTPQNTDSLRIANVIRRVHVRGLHVLYLRSHFADGITHVAWLDGCPLPLFQENGNSWEPSGILCTRDC